MKQVFIVEGKAQVSEVPAPALEPGEVLVDVAYSLISSGTERTAVQSSAASTLGNTSSTRVRQAADYVRRHGLRQTLQKARASLRHEAPVGYSCAGYIREVGKGVEGFSVGMAVACAGGGKAYHAELVAVPRNLVTPVPQGCALRDAASVAIGSIAMQGARRGDPRLGEFVAVIGLGLVGQITVQLLHASGCRVVGFDIDSRRVETAIQLGAEHAFRIAQEDPKTQVDRITRGLGVDLSVITASSQSNTLVQTAMEITRKKGRVVIVGDVGLALKRSPFYQKEIDLLISSSYGPGRYDADYEERGVAYPYAYVRWTETRNMEEYLRLISVGDVQLGRILERELPIEEAETAYELINAPKNRPLGVLLRYKAAERGVIMGMPAVHSVSLRASAKKAGRIGVAVVGAGGFARSMHLPNLLKLPSDFSLRAIVSRSGANAASAAKEFGAEVASTSLDDVIADPAVDAVILCTPHNLHAAQAIRCVESGKALLIEKPMALNLEELDRLVEAAQRAAVPVMVGFNRRHSPAARKLHALFENRTGPMTIAYTMSVRPLPPEHWVKSPEGGGRIAGEACHVVDLFQYLMKPGRAIRVCSSLGRAAGAFDADDAVITVTYDDGSLGTLTYQANGSSEAPKERCEVSSDSITAVIDDYRALSILPARIPGWKAKSSEKGHLEELRVFADVVRGKAEPPASIVELAETTRITLLAARAGVWELSR